MSSCVWVEILDQDTLPQRPPPRSCQNALQVSIISTGANPEVCVLRILSLLLLLFFISRSWTSNCFVICYIFPLSPCLLQWTATLQSFKRAPRRAEAFCQYFTCANATKRLCSSSLSSRYSGTHLVPRRGLWCALTVGIKPHWRKVLWPFVNIFFGVIHLWFQQVAV